MLGVGGVGLFCGEGAPPDKGNQGKLRETKGNPRKPKENQGKPKENQGKPKENQGKPLQSTKEIPSNQWEYLQSIGFLSKQG